MKTSLAVNHQVPEFVRSEYPNFVEFLRAYYTWYEQYNPGDIDDLLDIDSTIDQFVKYFRKQLDVYGITVDLDDRTYLKKIKELYYSKGSFAGVEFLLKLTLNKQSTVFTPWDYVFRPSDGKWYQDTSVLVNITKGNADNLVGNAIAFIDSNDKKYKTFVTNINKRDNDLVEIFFNRFPLSARLISFESIDNNITGLCNTTITKVNVEKSGKGFRIGQIFSINSASGSGTLIKVKHVDKNGGIKSVEIIKFGTGYKTDFNYLISPSQFVDYQALGAKIQLNSLTYLSDDNVSSQTERGQIVRHNYTNLTAGYLIDPTYVGESVAEISQTPQNYFDNDSIASLRFIVGSTCIYPGYYKTNDNIIGDSVFIQDSKYYQAFSYVTVLEDNIDKYSELLKNTMHPAGTRQFATYQLNYNYDIVPQIDPALNILSRRDAFRDFAIILDEIRNAIGKVLETEFTTITDALRYYINKQEADSAIVTEALSNLLVKEGLTDTATITELFDIVPGFEVKEILSIVDTITEFISNKYLTDSVQTGNAESSGVYMEPYYVEPVSPMPYWNPEYMEEERSFIT